MSFGNSWIQSLECLRPAPTSQAGIADPGTGVLSVLGRSDTQFCRAGSSCCAKQCSPGDLCALHTALSWIVRWAKSSALAVNTNQCHELSASGCRVSFNSPKSRVMQRYDASSGLSCSGVLPQQISVSWYQNTWYAKESCILYRLRFYLKYGIEVICTLR